MIKLPFVTWCYDAQKHTKNQQDEVSGMVEAYIECACWADCPEDEDWSEIPISDEAKEKALFDCSAFLMLARHNIRGWTMAQLGHDFFLSRNGHGSGFFDRDVGTEDSREKLQVLAEQFGTSDVYSARGWIYLE